MAEASWLASILTAIDNGKQLVNAFFHHVLAFGSKYRTARFGWWGVLLHWLPVLDTNGIQSMHWNINCWKDEEVMQWKSNYISGCNAVSVAGAIFASVGITALQLPYLDATHWSARALLSSSMVLGIIAVVCSTTLQQEVGRLNNPLDIRLWLSRGKVELEKCPYDPPYRLLPLESSISALKISEIPGTLLRLAVLLFLAGFGLYLLFSWLNHVDASGTDYRNIFTVFVIVIGLFCCYYTFWSVSRALDAQKREEEFDLRMSDTFAKPDPQQQLEEVLKALQGMHKLDPDSEEDTREFMYLYSFVYERQMRRVKRNVEPWRDLMRQRTWQKGLV